MNRPPCPRDSSTAANRRRCAGPATVIGLDCRPPGACRRPLPVPFSMAGCTRGWPRSSARWAWPRVHWPGANRCRLRHAGLAEPGRPAAAGPQSPRRAVAADPLQAVAFCAGRPRQRSAGDVHRAAAGRAVSSRHRRWSLNLEADRSSSRTPAGHHEPCAMAVLELRLLRRRAGRCADVARRRQPAAHLLAVVPLTLAGVALLLGRFAPAPQRQRQPCGRSAALGAGRRAPCWHWWRWRLAPLVLGGAGADWFGDPGCATPSLPRRRRRPGVARRRAGPAIARSSPTRCRAPRPGRVARGLLMLMGLGALLVVLAGSTSLALLASR